MTSFKPAESLLTEREIKERAEVGGMHAIRCMCCCPLSDWLHALLPNYVTLLPSQGGIYFAGAD